jgi:hypothetical protein
LTSGRMNMHKVIDIDIDIDADADADVDNNISVF